MRNKTITQYAKALGRLSLLALAFATTGAHATLWTLSDTPLFLGTAVPANIVFLIDDSGSMGWDAITRDWKQNGLVRTNQPDGTDVAGFGTLPVNPYGTNCKSVSYRFVVDHQLNYSGDACDVATSDNWRFRNHDFNPLYFDPKRDYVPWEGVDDQGVAFANMPVAAAWYDPYSTKDPKNEAVDLTAGDPNVGAGNKRIALPGGMYFYTWTDGKEKSPATVPATYYAKDGKYQDGEQTAYQIGNLNGELGTIPAVKTVALWGKTVAQVQQNFANWFSYYRSRHLMAKGAFGHTIATVQNMRLGMATIHPNSVHKKHVALIDSSVAGEANRAALLAELYQLDPNGATPTLSALHEIGKYLSGKTNSYFSSSQTAPLPAGSGGECQQNFTLLLTDGFYQEEKTQSPQILDTDSDGNSLWDGGNYKDLIKGKYTTLADIAMYYYETDIRPTTANNVPTILGVDQNNAQHMVTYGIAFGVNGSLKCMPDETTDADGVACPVFPGWPNPLLTLDEYKIDDLRHAAYNGRGEFLEANDPDKLVTALKAMLSSIVARSAATAALSFNTTTVRTDTLVFQAKYHTKDWAGDLLFIPFAEITGGVVKNFRSVATQVLKQDPTTRTIITSDGTTSAPFRWANLTAAQQTALNSDPLVLDFLRGDRNCELEIGDPAKCGGTLKFRHRGSVWPSTLGDIINSAPVFVGAPNRYYSFDGYADFAVKYANRKPLVYVGANDGLLHGFDASINKDGTFPATSGQELIAYVPNTTYSKLASLSSPSYSHTYFIDGSPTAGDANFGDATNPDWHTVVVEGMRGGGQAMMALDVTDPSIFSEATPGKTFLWEFTDKNDADLGLTFSDPIVIRLATGKWAAVFGNGLNNTIADANPSTTGNAVIYVVDIATGTLIKKLNTGYGMAKDPTGGNRANGVMAVAAMDADQDFKVDFLYGGDMFGNLWRFDVSDVDPAKWGISFGGKPLFTAKSPDGSMQSITAKMTIGPHPLHPGYLIYFGTGRYLNSADNIMTGVPTQTFYSIWDQWEKGDATAFAPFTRANLLQQQILNEVGFSWGSNFRVTTDNIIDWSKHKGWYMDLVNVATGKNNGERVITEPVLRNGRIIFSTLIPASGPCIFGGTGWLMILDAFDGSRLGQSPLDLNGDGRFTSADLVNGYAVSGSQSTHGIPSAPALIQGEGGTTDLILMNFSDGSLGGTGATNTAPVITNTQPCDPGDLACTPEPVASQTSPPEQAITGTPQGRLMWQRLQ